MSDDHRGHRQEGQAGRDRREAEVLLHVVGEEQEHGEHAGAGEGDRQVRAAAGAVAARCAAAAAGALTRRSISDEGDQQQQADGQRDDRQSAVQECVSALEKP